LKCLPWLAGTTDPACSQQQRFSLVKQHLAKQPQQQASTAGHQQQQQQAAAAAGL
jgi:hypothetical protein